MATQIRGNKQIKNITIENSQLVDGTIELNKLKDGSELLKRNGTVSATGDFDLGSHNVKNLAAPVDDNDAVRKADLDAATSGAVVNREIPSGVANGTNTDFILANVPNLGSEQVFLNGSMLNAGANCDYVVDESTITFTIAPQAGDVILVNYITDGVVLNVDVTNTLNQINARLTTAESELFTAQGDVTALSSDVDGLDTRVTSAESDIVSVEGNVSTLQSTVSSIQSSVSTVSSGLTSEQSARIAGDDALDTAVSSVQTSVTSLGNRMNTAEGDIVALESADAAFDVRVGDIEDGLQAETTARTSADSALSSRVTTLENAPAPVTSLSALSDVTITSPSANQILKYNGTGWVNGAAPSTFSGSYNDLTDKPSLFSGSYTDLTNKPTLASFTTLTSPASGQYLKFNGSAWVNSALPEASTTQAGILTTAFQIIGGEKRFASTIQASGITSSGTTLSLSGGLGGTFPGGKIVFTGGSTTGSMDFYTKVNGQQFQEQIRANISDLGLFSMYYGASIQSGAAATKALIVKGAASQTANLFEAQNSSGTALFSIDKDGSMAAGSVPVARVTGLHAVATGGSYNDLADKPSIPSIAGLATETYVDNAVAAVVNSAPAVLDTLNELAAALGDDPNFATTMTTALAAKADSSSLADVATSGSYNDLSDKPSIPSISGLASEAYVDAAVASKADSASLADVATSGDYSDLTNKPAIPTGVKEVPSGDIDGMNSQFVLSNVPMANTLQVFLNGLLQMPVIGEEDGDYNLAADTITFTQGAPEVGWKVFVYYFV